MYIVAGPEQVLGVNPSSGEYKIISTGKGDLSGATVEEVLDFKRGPFNRLAGKALQEGFEPLDYSGIAQIMKFVGVDVNENLYRRMKYLEDKLREYTLKESKKDGS